MDGKSVALELIRLAAMAFPPIAALLKDLLSRQDTPEMPLADEIRNILPADGASYRALQELDAPDLDDDTTWPGAR